MLVLFSGPRILKKEEFKNAGESKSLSPNRRMAKRVRFAMPRRRGPLPLKRKLKVSE